jgi:lipopolysaccharide biosynthesis glycosyltransferase
MYKCFIGYDERQPVSFNVLQQSIISQTSKPVAIIPLILKTLPIERGWPKPNAGLTPFTWSRFLVPHLCNYEGKALFLDVDIVLNGDISELFSIAEHDYCPAVYVSKNQHRFEWASVMLFNCAHEDNKKLTPEFIETAQGLHGINWTDSIGDLPREWNHLVGYDAPKEAKLVHYTQGIPAFDETETSEYSSLWRKWATLMNSSRPWDELMGQSVHSVEVNGVRMPKFLWDLEAGKPKPEHMDKVKKLLKVA